MMRAVLGGGCFWCVETILSRLRGVQKVESGYSGGHTLNPSYKEVCSGNTGHAEVVRVSFDSTVLPYAVLLTVFMHAHDPTTLNAQGNDIGTQYRSIIICESEEQIAQANGVLKELVKEGKYPGAPKPIVTQVQMLRNYYPAEQYHQNYYRLNTEQGYCQAVIKPKLSKFQQYYAQYIDQTKL